MSKETILSGLRAAVGEASPAERGFFFCAFSLLLPFPLTCAALLAAAVWVLFNREARAGARRQKDAKWLAVSAALALVVPLFYRRMYSFAAGIGLAVLLLCYLFARSALSAAKEPQKLFGTALDFCCLASFCCFIIGAAQKLFFGPAFRATAGMLNANYYGCAIEFISLIAVYRFYTNPRHRSFYVMTLAFNAVGVFLCDCQSVWLAVIGGVLAMLLVIGKRRLAAAFAGVSLVLLAAVAMIPGALPRLDRLPDTYATRMNIWTTAWRGFLQHPVFGQGLLSYVDVGKRLGGYQTYHAHSLYLDPLLSAGLVGTALAVRFMALHLRRAVNGCRRGFRREAALLVSVMTTTAIHGVTDIPILWVQTGGLLLLVLAGAAMWERALEETSRREET